jgi:hypothetical protein
VAPIPKSPSPPAGRNQNIFGGSILVLIFLVGVIWWAVKSSDRATTTSGFPQQTTQVPPPQLHRITIGSGALTVRATGYAYYTLTVPSGASNVRLQGRFTASGGSGNDIEVFLLSDTQYINWQNGHSTYTLYNSGKVTTDNVDAVLPDAGTYYLIFNNRFSLLTPKAIDENLALTYYQ